MIPPPNPLTDPMRRDAEARVAEAERAWGEGDQQAARRLFREAAELEAKVAAAAPASLPRARSAIAVAAVALFHRANDLERAKQVAYGFLAQEDGLTPQGRLDLERLVERCSREIALQTIVADSQMVPVEIKLEGGRVGFGVAPATAVRKRRDAFFAALQRSGEMECGLPYRDRGKSELDRSDEIELLEVPARAASFGIQFYVATGDQQRIAAERRVTPERVVERFLSLAKAAEEGPTAVHAEVPDAQYANAFVSSFAEIAGDGEQVGSVACSAPTWGLRGKAVVLGAAARESLRAALPEPVPREPSDGDKIIEGILTRVELTKSWKWATLRSDDGEDQILIVEDKNVRLKAATLRASDDDVRVRTVVRWSDKKRRYLLLDVTKLGGR